MKFPLKEPTIAQKVEKTTKDLKPEMDAAFHGRRSAVSLGIFIVGGVLIGNTLWNLLSVIIGKPLTGMLGVMLFIMGGVLTHEFRQK